MQAQTLQTCCAVRYSSSFSYNRLPTPLLRRSRLTDGSLHRPVISSAAFKSGCVSISCRLPVQFSHQVRITGKSVTDPVRKFFWGRNDILKGNRGIFHIRGINGNQPCSILRGGDTDPQLSFDVCSLYSRHPSFYKGVKSLNSYSNSTSGEISSQSFFRRIL